MKDHPDLVIGEVTLQPRNRGERRIVGPRPAEERGLVRLEGSWSRDDVRAPVEVETG